MTVKRRRMVMCLLMAAVAGSVPLGSTAAVAASAFTVVELGTAGFDTGGAASVNDNGQVVGTLESSGFVRSAFIWERGRTRALGRVDGRDTVGSGINDGGEVVGSTIGGVYDPGDAVVWTANGNPGLLQPPAGHTGSSGSAINEAGQVAGTTGFGPRAVRWSQLGEPRLVGALGGTDGVAWGINDGGQVVGYARAANYTPRAFLWHPDTGMRDLGTFTNSPTGTAAAYAVNNHGHVVGSADAGFRSLPFLWRDGHLTALGTVTGQAYGINERDDVVGQILVRGSDGRFVYHAFGYRDGVLRDLNDLIPDSRGIVLNSARDINNQGWIIANGANAAGRQRAFLLIPAG
jgi:probable HAF family extracellular repeat protein